MKQFLPKSIERLTSALSRLPGVGPKSASRLAFYLLNRPDDEVQNLGQAIIDLKATTTRCSVCFTIAESDPCAICTDENRNMTRLAVVEEPLDMVAVERAGFDGRYHVLGGVVSPINGVGPNDLRISELLDRIKTGKIDEVVLATDPSLEGEATAMYIRDRIVELSKKISVTRIARGLPVGGDLEYADELTLQRALEGRSDYK